MTEQLLNIHQVEAWTGMNKGTLYRQMAQGQFPRPIRIGLRAVRWRERDLQAWLESRPKVQEVPA